MPRPCRSEKGEITTNMGFRPRRVFCKLARNQRRFVSVASPVPTFRPRRKCPLARFLFRLATPRFTRVRARSAPTQGESRRTFGEGHVRGDFQRVWPSAVLGRWRTNNGPSSVATANRTRHRVRFCRDRIRRYIADPVPGVATRRAIVRVTTSKTRVT